MAHPLDLMVQFLAARAELSGDDQDAVRALPFTLRTVPRASYLVREGDRVTHCNVLVQGFVYRHKVAASGARQIVSLHIPGEALDCQSLYLNYVDHNAQTLTQAEIATVPMAALRALVAERSAVAAAIIHSLLIEASVLREWVLNVGKRTARERLAHLFCEYALRLDRQGLSSGSDYELPMTQEQLGDALGLTGVHVNRSLRALREEGLIQTRGRIISFPDIRRLREVADFGELYLHLND